MLDMVLAVKGSDIRSSKRTSALVTKKPEPSEVVRLTERILAAAFFIFGREELGCDDLAAVLKCTTCISVAV